jgi:hypothetical protein
VWPSRPAFRAESECGPGHSYLYEPKVNLASTLYFRKIVRLDGFGGQG